jgi:NAD+ diphosphatase
MSKLFAFHESNILVSGVNQELPDSSVCESIPGAVPIVLDPDVAIALSERPELNGYEFIPLREYFASSGAESADRAGRAYHLLNWEKGTRFCGRCGAPTKDKEDERAKVCTACGAIVYPRISPAVITLITKGKSILLAHNAHFKAGMFSLIAGFVEPGETLEKTVAREILEEVGIEVDNIRYQGSQPWPFPDSLMLGFRAEYRSGDIKPDGIEIVEAGWFTRDTLPNLPLKGSLSRLIIEEWLAGKQ